LSPKRLRGMSRHTVAAHFSFHGPGVSPLVITQSVLSFQKLWNLNHPEDQIDQDGVYGDKQTGARLLRSPIEGFELTP